MAWQFVRLQLFISRKSFLPVREGNGMYRVFDWNQNEFSFLCARIRFIRVKKENLYIVNSKPSQRQFHSWDNTSNKYWVHIASLQAWKSPNTTDCFAPPYLHPKPLDPIYPENEQCKKPIRRPWPVPSILGFYSIYHKLSIIFSFLPENLIGKMFLPFPQLMVEYSLW